MLARQAAAEAVERRAEAIKAEAETQANRILADALAEKESLQQRSRQLQDSNQRLSPSVTGMHAQSPQTTVCSSPCNSFNLRALFRLVNLTVIGRAVATPASEVGWGMESRCEYDVELYVLYWKCLQVRTET